MLYNEELLVLFSFCCFCFSVQKYASAEISANFAEMAAQRKREAASPQVVRAVACADFLESVFASKKSQIARAASLESQVAFIFGFCSLYYVFGWCIPLRSTISQIRR